MKISIKFTILGFITLFVAILVSFLFGYRHAREHASTDAERLAHLILAEKQAVITYVSNDLRPRVIAALKRNGVDKPDFDPAWMSASYVNRKLTEYLNKQGYRDFYYKNAAINARHPDNEANQYEHEFIRLVENGEVTERSLLSEIDGETFFLHMQKNESMFTDQCMLCHSKPENAPAKLLELYGPERGFDKKPGALASVLSLRIPVQLAQNTALTDFLPLISIFSGILLLSIVSIWFYVKKILVSPIELLTNKALAISEDESRLGETVEIRSSQDLENLSEAFNRMSLALKVERDNLDDRVKEKTSELVIANEKLRESEEAIRLLVNSKAEAIYSVDLEGNCIFCNISCLKLLGYQSETELLGKNIHSLVHHTDVNGQKVATGDCRIIKAIRDSKAVSMKDDIFWRSDGEPVQVDWRAAPMHRQGAVIGSVVTFVDVAEQRQQQMKELRLNQLAALGEMAAGVAHEINNPINGVINYAKMLEKIADKGSREQDIVNRITKEGLRIADIVSKLLTHAHYDANKISRFKAQDIVSDSLALLNKQVEKEGIIFDFDLPEKPIFIQGNKQQLEQVLINLISNAKHALGVKYPEASVDKIIRVSLSEKNSEEDMFARIIVWDQGCGISDEIISKVTNPFFTTKEAGVGTGLGLSISQEIVRKHGGTMHIESEVGAFTKVVIELPLTN